MWWCALAFGAPAAERLEQARDAVARADWAAAAALQRKLVREAPEEGQRWFELGTSEYQLGRWRAAADAWARSGELGVRPAVSAYNRGCALARLGDADGALAALEVAVGQGRTPPGQLAQDPDLASLAADPRFVALVARAEALAHPCDADPRRRALDLWVGAFDVTSQGQRVGGNVITREEHGCVLLERWTDAVGGTGSSFTWFDPGTQRWRQLWIDASGRIAEYVGDFEEPGRLVMVARTVGADGTEGQSRGTWSALPDGTVRQRFESPGPDGQWAVTFDAIYTRTP